MHQKPRPLTSLSKNFAWNKIFLRNLLSSKRFSLKNVKILEYKLYYTIFFLEKKILEIKNVQQKLSKAFKIQLQDMNFHSDQALF